MGFEELGDDVGVNLLQAFGDALHLAFLHQREVYRSRIVRALDAQLGVLLGNDAVRVRDIGPHLSRAVLQDVMMLF